jgi:hypothetical protein
MAHELPDAQLALRGHVAGSGIALMMAAGHDRPEFFIRPGLAIRGHSTSFEEK